MTTHQIPRCSPLKGGVCSIEAMDLAWLPKREYWEKKAQAPIDQLAPRLFAIGLSVYCPQLAVTIDVDSGGVFATDPPYCVSHASAPMAKSVHWSEGKFGAFQFCRS